MKFALFLLLLHSVSSTPKHDADDGIKIRRLFEWAKQNGAFIHPCLEYRDAGMYASCAIPMHTEIVCVPRDIMLRKNGSTTADQLKLVDIILSADENHAMWPYIDALPKSCQMPACRPIDRSFVTLLGAKRISEVPPPTWNDWSSRKKAVTSVVRTRTWPNGMVPIIDLFNHNSRRGKMARFLNGEKITLSLVNFTRVCLSTGNFVHVKGDQVFDDYGIRSQFHGYRQYGFIPSEVSPTCKDMTLLRIASNPEMRTACIAEMDSTIEDMMREHVEAKRVGDDAMMKGVAKWMAKIVPEEVILDVLDTLSQKES